MNILECFLLLWQVAQNMQQLRSDVVGNATAHAAALAGGAKVADVRADLAACAEQYDRRIQWMESLLADEGRRAKLAYALSPWPDAMAEVDRQAGEARMLITLWQSRPTDTAEEIQALCAEAQHLVSKADMLWNA